MHVTWSRKMNFHPRKYARSVAVHIEFESKGLKPFFHFIYFIGKKG
jgi:hypothetical protein